MRVLELFSGTGNLTKIARKKGHTAHSIDLTEPADTNADILQMTPQEILGVTGWDSIDMLWASPPCQGFSVASIGKMWSEPGKPKHPTSEMGLSLLEHTLHIIKDLQPKTWYIENPRGMMRKMPSLEGFTRHTITFCQYGEQRMKPTDVWTNSKQWEPRPACRNGDSCHVKAPRGSTTGTQGMKNAKAKGRLPDALCEEVLAASDNA